MNSQKIPNADSQTPKKVRLDFSCWNLKFAWRLVVGIWNFQKRYPWLAELFVFVAMLALYLPLQQSTGFADPDALYHLKIAELTAAHGPVREFIWMPYSTLAASFADHHFLYHVALIPFIKILGSLHGIKFATAVFAAAAIAALAWALRYVGVRYAALFALLAGIMNPLAFRIGLSKASALGVLLLVVGLAFAIKRRPWPLFAVAFIYVWTHGSWPALLGLGTIAIIMMSWNGKLISTFHVLRSSLLALWLGVIAGILINPFFPNNIKFYWEQIVQIAVINYQAKIGVGSEWYPYNPHNLLSALPLLACLAVVAIIIFPSAAVKTVDGKENNRIRVALALTISALVFLGLTLRSQRHVEYFVPLAVAASAAWIGEWGFLKNMLKTKGRILPFALAVCCAVSIVGAFGRRELNSANRDLSSGYEYTLYKKAAEYLKNNAEPGEVIVHADWDDMPSLFYWNDNGRYIMGLDPTFTYRANPTRYWDYVNFTLGKSSDPVAVMKELNSRFVFSDREHLALDMMLKKSGSFKLVYSDNEAEVYLLK